MNICMLYDLWKIENKNAVLALNIYTDNIKEWVWDIAVNDSMVSFKLIHANYYMKLLRFVTMYIGETVVAEEIVSDSFLSVWENRRSLKMVTNFNSYIYAVAKYKSVSYLRSKHPQSVELDEGCIDMFIHTDTTPEQELISKEGILKLNAAINRLPEKCKLAFKLVREEKMKYKEAAEILGISQKTLEAHIAKAVKTLRGVIENDFA